MLYESVDWSTKMRERYGAPFVDIHRGQLQLLMYHRAIALGVTIKLGVAVKSINHEQAMIHLQSGMTYHGDLVVGADGLWSVCRESLLGQSSKPQPTGDLAYRIVLQLDEVPDAELQRMIKGPACRLWIGPNSHVVAYSLKGGQQFNIVLLVPDDLPLDVIKTAGDISEMRALFRGWDPILTKFLNCVNEVQKWKLMHLHELKTWRNEQGNFLLLGDSCHPMLPYLAQGASSAIEDGAVLGRLLGKVISRKQLPEATAVWQQLRKQRSEFLVKQASIQVSNAP
jgi:salicylate hydroxylase